ncbi:MAG: hypothetical protein KA319_05200 [Ferruginibacter sp.]|nr:hypothetical protein [Ferruginibacter sp.]
MSLDNIQLPVEVVTNLFKNSLVELDSQQPSAVNKTEASFNFLGNHEKKVVILVNEPDAIYLKEEELNLLLNILAACKLTMADIAVVNIAKNTITYKQLNDSLQSQIVLLIGTTPAEIDLPLDFPMYKIQVYNNQQYVCSVSLQHLLTDKVEKGKLWLTLKAVFNI